QYFPYQHGIPKHDTIARVLSRLDPEALQKKALCRGLMRPAS
ncbi:MAG TPA: transposase family protein, partial [Aeromonadales bacterium]|nr:transposase family protein [Aeromonadales bacterium]